MRSFITGTGFICLAFILFPNVQGYTTVALVKLLDMAGYWLCVIIALLTLWLAIIKKAQWKEAAGYFIAVLLLSALFLFTWILNFQATAIHHLAKG